MRGTRWLAACLISAASTTLAWAQPAGFGAAADDPQALIVVAIADRPEPVASAGSPPRLGYRRAPSYTGSDRARAEAKRVAGEYGLQEVAGWPIATLGLRCMLFRLPPGADRVALLARLAADKRITLAQALNQFETLAVPAIAPSAISAISAISTTAPTAAARYNDPYLALQSGLATLQALRAHDASQGALVRVAVVDSAVDAHHPDLLGRIVEQRDFVGAARGSGAEPHGTQVAGVLAANAHNAQGIVGVAPLASLLAYRACWALASGGSRCNSYTLALALAAATERGAQIINLSLAGPRDALLEALARDAQRRGALIVGALPADGSTAGFPLALAGVIAVASSSDRIDNSRPPNAIAAPGERVLTLMPGGSYDFASGSSLAAAQVSGVLALMRALEPSLDSARAQRLLSSATGAAAGASVDACRAVQALRPQQALGCVLAP